ncbi:MAG: MFS transporter [Proteobacteria bacterium]|nr:MFS transporter [Pseudomonadota bacterium]
MKPAEQPIAREWAILLVLAGVQISHILDFMILMPLGPQFMRIFAIGPTQFGFLVSVYTFSSAAVGFAAAFFIDRFDRKKALLLLYACFAATTLLAASSQSYPTLLAARALAGAFSGVLSAIVFAIVSDLIPESRRGSALGVVMSAFSIAATAGVPVSLYLANHFTWRAPFFFITGLCLTTCSAAAWLLPRMRGHLSAARERHPLEQALAVFRDPNHHKVFLFSAMLFFSGFAVIPFISPFMVSNVGVAETRLPMMYLIGGVLTLAVVRFVGRLTDLHGKRRMFTLMAGASALAILVVTHLPRVSIFVAVLASAFLMAMLSGRFVPAMALITSSVTPRLRGSFMSFNSSIQGFAAGMASFGASLLMGRNDAGELTHYGTVGVLAVVATLASIWLARRIRPARAAP